jgi:hypothetical protein
MGEAGTGRVVPNKRGKLLRPPRCLDSLSHFPTLRTQSYFKFRKQITLFVCPIWPQARWNRTLGMYCCNFHPLGIPYSSFLSLDVQYCSLRKPAIFRPLSYMYSNSHHTESQAMQRSQSTPNVGARPAEQRLRRTKTNIDFFAVPPRSAIDREKRVDPFNLAGFFPSSLRKSDQEPSGWWRDEGTEEGSEELASEMAMLEGYSSSLSSSLESQRVLFSKEDQSADAVIKGEDKFGVLTICAHSHFMLSSSVNMPSGCSDRGTASRRTARLGGWDRGVPAFALYQ